MTGRATFLLVTAAMLASRAAVAAPPAGIGAAPASDTASALADLRARLPEIERTRRGRWPAVTPLLRDLGPDALPALLEEMRHPGKRPGGLRDDTWSAWRAGVVEAVGALRAREAMPLLAAALADPHGDALVVRAAAEALGKIADDRIAAELAIIARSPGPRQAAVLGGMGGCRRVACVDAVGDALVTGQIDVVTAKSAVRSLGRAGAAWAWQTTELRGRPDADIVRHAAAEALVKAFVRWDGEVRQTASNALMAVGHPDTPNLVAISRSGAAPALVRALDGLSARFARDSQGH